MNAIRLGSASLALLMLAALPARAQRLPSLGEGAHVRIRVAGDTHWVFGDIATATKDSIFLLSAGLTVRSVARTSIDNMEIRTGTRRHAMQGLGVGMLAGSLVGGIGGLIAGDDACQYAGILLGCFGRFTGSQKAIIFGTGMGIVGGVAGVISGFLHTSDVWTSASTVATRVSLRATPLAGTTGVGLSLRF